MSDWIAFPLSRLAEVRVSNVDKIARLGETPVQLCNYMDVYTNDYIDSSIEFMQSTANLIEKEKFKVCSGDVIITKDSETPFDIGIPAVVIDDIRDLVCGYHLALIKPYRDKVEPVYLAKQLASNEAARYFSRMAAGSTRYGLSNGAIAATAIPIAPLEQQKKIAAILRAIDKTIEKTEALIHKYQQIKAGLMHDLFTRGLTADGKLRPTREQAPELYQEVPVGWIPKEWEVKSLRQLVGSENIVNGPFGSDLLTSELRSEGVPVLYVQDIRPGNFNKISTGHVTILKAAQLSFCNVRKNDVLVAKVGSPPCDACIYPLDYNAIVTQDVIRIRPTANVDSQYLASILNATFGRKSIKKISIEGTRERVSLTDFKKLSIPVAGYQEQKAIGERLSLIQDLIDKEEAISLKCRKQKCGLMHDLLTGLVRVKVDDSNNQEAAA